jgi:hypothetical protein
MQGPCIPAHQQILLYSAGQWQSFVHEWAFFCLKTVYKQVQEFGGAKDRGIDVVGFTDDQELQGIWDNFQCKHYDHPLHPSDAWPEIGKLLWHAYSGAYKPPRSYFFVAPRGVGTTLAGLLADAAKLKQELKKNWDKHCRKKITDTQEIKLEGAFLQYVDAFDFSIFGMKTGLEIVEAHHLHCPFHAARFGGGLPDRPAPETPPTEIAPIESRYVAQLLHAYADHTKKPVTKIGGLKSWPKLDDHFGRQRVAFYHAESLRVFARDSVPPGTFESLQDDIYTGVIDTHDSNHADGYERVCAVTKAARDLQITSNPLITCAKPQDRDGICHQLANEDRLKWTKP